MPTILDAEQVLTLLRQTAEQHGLHCHRHHRESLRGEIEVVQARWFFGERRHAYFLDCRLDEADRVVRFRETVRDTASGLPAPVVTAGKATASGGAAATAGGQPEPGPLEYFRLRQALEQTVRDAGWRSCFEVARH
jgi:hypothetical protein